MGQPVNVLVVAGGPFPEVPRSDLAGFDLLIAADAGADHALAMGLIVDVLVGDLDSVSAAGRDAAKEIVAYPAEKDASDLELAIHEARNRGADEVTVVLSTAGRTDHALLGLHLLGNPEFVDLTITGLTTTSVIAVVRDEWHVAANPGQILSLVAWGATAVVSISGVRWPLDRHRLHSGDTLGLSNIAVQRDVRVKVDEGCAFVIVDRPG